MLNLTAMRVARARLNITKKEAAKMIGISHLHYCRVENGIQNISITTAQAICKGLGISPNELLSEEIVQGDTHG